MRLVLTLFLVLMASVASAQTANLCGDPIPVSPTVVSPVPFGWCHDSKDSDGSSVVLTRFELYLDGQASPIYSGLPTATPMNASGEAYFQSPSVAIPKGSRSVTVRAFSADGGSSLSVAYGFSVSGKPPKPPTKTRTPK